MVELPSTVVDSKDIGRVTVPLPVLTYLEIANIATRAALRNSPRSQISREISRRHFSHELADFPPNFRKPTPRASPDPSTSCGVELLVVVP